LIFRGLEEEGLKRKIAGMVEGDIGARKFPLRGRFGDEGSSAESALSERGL